MLIAQQLIEHDKVQKAAIARHNKKHYHGGPFKDDPVRPDNPGALKEQVSHCRLL